MIAALEPTTEYHFRSRMELKSLLFVTNDPDDFVVAQEEVRKLKLANPIRRVRDAEDLSQYLAGDGPYVIRANHPLPLLIVVDVTLPDGGCLKAQAVMRSHHATHALPLIVAGKKEDIDSLRLFNAINASGYVGKPFSRLDFGRILLENKIPLTVFDSDSPQL